MEYGRGTSAKPLALNPRCAVQKSFCGILCKCRHLNTNCYIEMILVFCLSADIISFQSKIPALVWCILNGFSYLANDENVTCIRTADVIKIIRRELNLTHREKIALVRPKLQINHFQSHLHIFAYAVVLRTAEREGVRARKECLRFVFTVQVLKWIVSTFHNTSVE